MVVEGCIEAKLQEPGHLGGGTRRTDDPGGTHGLGDLAHQRADGSCRAGDEHGVTGFEFGDLEQSGVGGQHGHPEGTQDSRRRRQVRAGRLHGFRVKHGVFPPAKRVHDDVPSLSAVPEGRRSKRSMAGGGELAQGFAQLLEFCGRVRCGVGEPERNGGSLSAQAPPRGGEVDGHPARILAGPAPLNKPKGLKRFSSGDKVQGRNGIRRLLRGGCRGKT